MFPLLLTSTTKVSGLFQLTRYPLHPFWSVPLDHSSEVYPPGLVLYLVFPTLCDGHCRDIQSTLFRRHAQAWQSPPFQHSQSPPFSFLTRIHFPLYFQRCCGPALSFPATVLPSDQDTAFPLISWAPSLCSSALDHWGGEGSAFEDCAVRFIISWPILCVGIGGGCWRRFRFDTLSLPLFLFSGRDRHALMLGSDSWGTQCGQDMYCYSDLLRQVRTVHRTDLGLNLLHPGRSGQQ